MRQTLLTLLTLTALAAAAAPASAQPLPEQIRAVVRDGVNRARDARTVTKGSYQQGREEQTDRQTRTLRLGADGELSVSNIAGDIVVTRAGGNEASVEIVKTARARTSEEARELLGLVQVAVTERNGRAEVKTVYPRDDEMRRNNRRNMNVSVAYTIAAPAGTRLTIGSISGSIRVTDIKGDLTLNTISGGVHVANAGRIASAKSVSGDVEVADTQIDGALDAQSISGSVAVRRVTARRIDLGTVSGSVVIEDVQSERVEGHSVSGNVDFTGQLARNGRYELNSHSGNVRIAVGGGVGFELEADSFSGSVRSDLPITMPGGDRGERGRRRAIRGVYGDGSAVLDVTTFSGSIVGSKR
jgi:DUF4097 and DUF4098 domain-containing protein YvlB